MLVALFITTWQIDAVDSAEQGEKSESNHTERYKLAAWNFHHVEIPYVICLWVLLASVTKLAFHLYKTLSANIPESCLLITLGVCTGAVLHYTKAASTDQYVLNADTFFLFLLPPIIFDAGYHMPNRAFFNNLGTILLLAVVNTLWNTVAIGLSLWGMSYIGWIERDISWLHCFLFSALISAVDPVAVLAIFEEIHVNEMLYIIVFGESLLNDGVTVVLYHMLESYSEIGETNILPIDVATGFFSFFIIALGGTLIGIIYGLIGGFITKYTESIKVIEPLFVFVLGYLAYLTAEMVHLSSILALTFGGITMRHYVELNMTKTSITTCRYFMKLMGNISETVIFMFLGLSTVVETHDWQLDFIFFTLLFCIVFRVMGIVTIAFFVNRTRLIQLSKFDQFIMSYGGLRGGIAFCLALLLNEDIIPEKRMFVSTTIVVVFFTVFLQGITIKPVVNALKVEKHVSDDNPTMNERFHRRFIDHLMAGIEDIVGRTGHNSLRDKFEHYNTKYLKPFLLREKPKTRETKIFKVFTQINMQEAMDHIATHGHFKTPSVIQEPSLAKVIRSYSTQSLCPSSTGDTVIDNKTVLDMQAVDVYYSKKMADDSRIHHILEDAMFKPRKTWVKENHYQLSEVHNHPPFRHKERFQLRRFISQAYRLKSSQQQNGVAHTVVEAPKPSKNVSFNELPTTTAQPMQEIEEECPNSPTVSDQSPVKFTLGLSEITPVDAIKSPSPPPAIKVQPPCPTPPTETEVEWSLPWKRQVTNDPLPSATSLDMPDDDRPLFSPLPSWACNPSYHHLKDSGSPYVSPETTITAPPPVNNQPSVFEVFQTVNDDQKDKTDNIPPPWKENNEIEPVTALPSNAMSDKANHNLHSFHDDKCIPSSHSVIIPSDTDDDLPKSSNLPGSTSNLVPKHWQPIEMQSIPRKRSMLEAEALMDEYAFQQEVSNRVQKWLESSNSDVEPGDVKMEDVEDVEENEVESDNETSYL
ncbi:hypothetical protein SNE40_007360 [Patella caerulea]|uniref:Sodium/hydrogen exchanger n=3 Tax=Patella caerulea TaxID=87958 RepID=A0AAN8JXR9_PATCE